MTTNHLSASELLRLLELVQNYGEQRYEAGKRYADRYTVAEHYEALNVAHATWSEVYGMIRKALDLSPEGN